MKRIYLLFFLYALVCTTSYAEVVSVVLPEVRSVCENELPFEWHGQHYYESGIYHDTIISEVDTFAYVLQLTVNHLSNYRFSDTICQGDVYNFNGRVLQSAGTYHDTILNFCECDSFIELNLIVIDTITKPIVSSSNQVLCRNEGTQLVASLHYDSRDSVSYQWFMSYDGINWAPVSGENSNTYLPGKSAVERYFKVLASSKKGCGSKESDPIVVSVFDAFHAGSISINGNPAIVCRNSSTDYQLTGEVATGGSGDYSYQWHQSDSTGENWTAISGATSIDLPAGQVITQKTSFCRIDRDTTCNESDTTDVITIDVYQSPTKPILEPYTDTVCYNGISDQLSVATPSTGYSSSDNVIYKWEYSDDNVTFYSLNFTGLTCTPQSKLTAPKWYRVNAVLASGCDSVYSEPIKVNVYNPLNVQVVSGGTTVCYMTSATLSVSASGVDGRYSYGWYESSDMSALGTLVGTSSTLSTPANTGGTHYYRCVVASTRGCGSDTSDVITVVTRSQFHAGSISLIVDSIVCPDSVVINPFSSVSPASGGSNNYTYQWQYMKNEKWISIPGENRLTLSRFNIETTIYFRRLDIDKECNDTIPSNVIKIDIFKGLSKPRLSPYSEIVCYDSVPQGQLSVVDFSVPVSPEDSVTYSWECTSDLDADFHPLNEYGTVYRFTENLTDTTYYRVVAKLRSDCGKEISDTVRVCVYSPLGVSKISGDTAVCYNTSATLRVRAYGVDNRYNYQWYYATNAAGNWSLISDATSDVYTTDPQQSAVTRYYKCYVTSVFGCGGVWTDSPFAVETKPTLNAGEIEGNDTICFNTSYYHITSSKPATGSFDDLNQYSWEYAALGSDSWTRIQNETTENLTVPFALRQSTKFRRVVSNSKCNPSGLHTDYVIIYVRDSIVAPVIKSEVVEDSICYGGSVTLTMENRPPDGLLGEHFTFEWCEATTGKSVHTGEVFPLDSIIQDQDYFVKAVSSRGCVDVSSDTVHIHVMAPLTVIIKAASTTSTLCFNEGEQLKAIANGSKFGSYIYNWQQQRVYSDGTEGPWEKVPDSSDSSIMDTPKRTEGETYKYCCIVTNGDCEFDLGTSNVMTLNTYKDIVPGILKPMNTIGYCSGDSVDSVEFLSSPTGDHETITWQYRGKGVNKWIDLNTCSSKNPSNLKYDLNQHAEILTDTLYVRAKLTNVCDIDSTPEIEVKINPLPEPLDISCSTSNIVCSNDMAEYSIPVDEYRSDCDYKWIIDKDKGYEVSSDSNKVKIQWTEESEGTSVRLIITDTLTQCYTECKPYIQEVRRGIDSVKIFQKRGSNILYCNDSVYSTYFYQWQRYKNVEEPENLDYGQGIRYIVVDTNDLRKYTYALILTEYDAKEVLKQCKSHSIFRGEIDSVAYKTGKNKIKASTHIRDVLSVRIENPDKMPTDLAVYSVSGILLYSMNFGTEEYIVEEMPVNLLPGVYFLHVKIGDEVSTIKLIAE